MNDIAPLLEDRKFTFLKPLFVLFGVLTVLFLSRVSTTILSVRPSVRLSVRLSRSGIASKQLNTITIR